MCPTLVDLARKTIVLLGCRQPGPGVLLCKQIFFLARILVGLKLGPN